MKPISSMPRYPAHGASQQRSVQPDVADARHVVERIARRRRSEPDLDRVPGLLAQSGEALQHEQPAGLDDRDSVGYALDL
jgi:hypothetical protein